MASSIQLLRSTNTQERPFPGNLLEGQPAVNLNASEPGLFFKAADGSLVKFGPAAITSDGSPPNSSPQGSTGNTIGELWLDKSVDPAVLKVYDGAAWVDAGSGGGGGGGTASFVRWIYTAAGGETSLSGSSGGVLLEYTPGLEDVYVNGVLITRGTDYSATNGTSITNLSALTAGDVITVTSLNPLETVQLPGQVTLLRWTVLATSGQTVLSGVDSSGQQLAYTPGFEEVYVNGAFLRRGTDYIATDGLTITGLSPLAEDDEITVMAWTAFSIADQIDSSLVTFTRLDSGAQPRTVKSRLSDTINVKDFGATGNGSNATSAINAAINAASASGGGAVYIPAGTYAVNQIIPKSNVEIYGDGESTVLTTTNASGGAFFISGCTNVLVRDLKIQGNSLQDPGDPQNGDTGAYVLNSSFVKFFCVHVDNTWGWGLISVGSTNVDFSHNTITNVQNQSGISFANGSKDCIASGNLIKGGKLYGLEAENSSSSTPIYCERITFTSNVVQDCIAGIGIAFAVQDTVVANNIFFNNNNVNSISGASGYGVYVVGDLSIANRSPRRLVISGNQIKNHRDIPVLFSGIMSGIVFSENIILKGSDVSKSERVFLAVNGLKSDFKITNNVFDCSGVGSAAVEIGGCFELKFSGNSIKNIKPNAKVVDFTTIGNSQIEPPIIPASEIPLMTSALDRLGQDITNSWDRTAFPEYTVLPGSSVNRYLKCKKNTKLVGVLWAVSPTSVGGGATDYWTVNIDGVDVGTPYYATNANEENWSFTLLSVPKNAGSIIDFRILNGLGTTFNFQRFQLISI